MLHLPWCGSLQPGGGCVKPSLGPHSGKRGVPPSRAVCPISPGTQGDPGAKGATPLTVPQGVSYKAGESHTAMESQSHSCRDSHRHGEPHGRGESVTQPQGVSHTASGTQSDGCGKSVTPQRVSLAAAGNQMTAGQVTPDWKPAFQGTGGGSSSSTAGGPRWPQEQPLEAPLRPPALCQPACECGHRVCFGPILESEAAPMPRFIS